MTSELLPGLALIVLFGLISGRSTGTRLFAFSWLSRKICVRTWSPRRAGLADRDRAGLQLGVGLGHDLEEAVDLDHREAEAAQRGEEVEVGLARRQRLFAVERDRAVHARVDDELLAQDRRHGARDAFDVGVDEVERHRLAAKAARGACACAKASGHGAAASSTAAAEAAAPALLQPGRARGTGLAHSHPIEMIDRAPSRRPMMLSRFDKRRLVGRLPSAPRRGTSRRPGPRCRCP